MGLIPPDLELFFVEYLRKGLRDAGESVRVSNKEPRTLSTPLSKPLVIVSDLGGYQRTPVSFSRGVSVSVLAGTAQNMTPARLLADHVYHLMTDDISLTLPTSTPIAAIDWENCSGFTVADDERNITVFSGTFEYIIRGNYAA